MWYAFMAKLDIAPKGLSCIMDGAGPIYIDEAYLNMGVNEGWLIRTGCFHDERNRLVWTYHHVRRPH